MKNFFNNYLKSILLIFFSITSVYCQNNTNEEKSSQGNRQLSDFDDTLNAESRSIYKKMSFDCSHIINEYGRKEVENVVRENNILFFIVGEDGKIFDENLKHLAPKDIAELIINFLDNGGDGSCNYCTGARNPASSNNPNEAFIAIQSFEVDAENSGQQMLFQRIVATYNYLWSREFSRENKDSDFNKLDCAEKNKIRVEYFPVNIIYYDKEYKSLYKIHTDENLRKIYGIDNSISGLQVAYESNSVNQREIVEIEIVNIKENTEEITAVPFAVVENVPIYPGCENLRTNEERKQCIIEKIEDFAKKGSYAGIANDLGLTGRQRIAVQFKINHEGSVVDITVRAPHPRLETEVKNVISKLPKMTPGKQRGKEVDVLYSLPILFQVEN